MLVYVFSDFQGEKVIPDGHPDLVILLGDIYYRDAEEIDKKYTCPKIGVYGNHDTPSEWDRTPIRRIHAETFEFNGVVFAGFGGCPRYNRRRDNQYTENECAEFMETLDAVDVFLSHSNPAYEQSLDETDAHRGFSSFNRYIENKRPSYFIHGHLHQPSMNRWGDTKVICVYPFLELNL